MGKRLLYLEDLYDFYSTYKKSVHFSSSDKKKPLTVQTHAKIKFEESDNTEGLTKCHLQACHTDRNVNGSFIKESVMNAALPSFSNRPILGYIHEVNGELQFYAHNMHEENGEVVYDEVPVGVIPESNNAKIVYDEEKDNYYVEIDGYIYDEYSKASEILEREGECYCSVELSIRELSYNAKEKYLDIEDMFFSGVTILGYTPEGERVMPGMSGANIKLADFSEDNNSIFAKKLDSLQEKIDKLISCYDTQNEGKEDTEVDTEKKFEEVTEVEEVAETEEATEEEVTEAENESEETVEETSEEVEENEENEEVEENFESLVRTFEISHSDIRCALYNLLSSFEESDNDWYYISNVYDSYFVYENWDGTRVFGQAYTKEDDNVSFSGERYELYKELLTASEKAELDSMRANYAALVEYKKNIEEKELHAKRESVLSDEKYSVIVENESFKKLINSMDSYSVEELEKEAKLILADYYTDGNFAEKPTRKISRLGLPVDKDYKMRGKYGNIFEKKNTK